MPEMSDTRLAHLAAAFAQVARNENNVDDTAHSKVLLSDGDWALGRKSPDSRQR
jgi:hypothetical protein